MGNASLRLGDAFAPHDTHQQHGLPVARILLDTGALTADQLADAMALQAGSDAPLEDVAFAAGMISHDQRAEARARHYAALYVTRAGTPPDIELAHVLPVALCLQHSCVPWARIGGALLVATARPDAFDALRSALPEDAPPVIMGLASEQDIHDTLAEWHRAALVAEAESCVPDALSCRSLDQTRGLRLGPLALGAVMLALLIYDARLLFAGLALWATGSLICAALLKLAAFAAHFKGTPEAPPPPGFFHRPKVAVMVPLFRETGIALDLVGRLKALTYPKALLDIMLVLEEEDAQTRALLDRSDLPPWMRVISVPKGQVTTKPRALNYALGFCDAPIVGVWDAEDAPAPDQIDRVVAHFAQAGPDVACLQGILDYYNAPKNWLSRCFAIEYATWFRVILPGLSRLGFAIPLGGTTIFFRRSALEKVHRWDAHNVTEDADLGIRLARYGYRTELLQTVTAEEACNRLWPWVRQRSRWLKGYMVTYLVHMRRPVQLFRDLGAWKFLGFQLFFVTTISQFLLAPVLWTFWLVLLGWAHPLDSWISAGAILHVGLAFLLAEVTSILIGFHAVARTGHKRLALWVPTLALYFPLGCVAAYKALAELIWAPFYWDKTSHGTSSQSG